MASGAPSWCSTDRKQRNGKNRKKQHTFYFRSSKKIEIFAERGLLVILLLKKTKENQIRINEMFDDCCNPKDTSETQDVPRENEDAQETVEEWITQLRLLRIFHSKIEMT